MERKKAHYLRDIRKVYDMRDRDPFAYEVIKKDIEMAKAGKASYITKGSLIRRITYSYSNRTPQSGGITTEQKNELMSLLSGVKDSCEMKTIDKLDRAIKALDEDKAYSVSYRIGNGPYQSIGVIAGSESEAIKKFRAYKEKRGQKDIEVIGASIGESLATMERKGKPIIR